METIKPCAEMIKLNEIKASVPIDSYQQEMSIELKRADGETVPIQHVHFSLENPVVQLSIQTMNNMELGYNYILHCNHEQLPVFIGEVVRTRDFDNLYYYDGDDLGVCYTKTSTSFTVWAPTATDVQVTLFENATDNEGLRFPFTRKAKGVWTTTIPGDWENWCFTYQLYIQHVWNEAVDPYVQAVTVNGEKGVIVDMEKYQVTDYPLPVVEKQDAIIYEVHIRDFSIHPHSGIKHKGKFLGFTETKTKGKKGTKTGLDYLVELGVTHVELLPLHDYGSVDEMNPNQHYNWGYDPIHYFAVEGSYSTNPLDGRVRIKELKQMIATLHEHGIKVILDVVFNHVYIWESSDFEKIVPGYYFRYEENGEMANGTGVGNDIASERKMVRKFILDCLKYWVREYKIDGFRFDLMGIFDLETARIIENELKDIRPDLFLLGEGWDLPTPLPFWEKATIKNAREIPTISFFNDRFRDVIRGSSFHKTDRGFINGNKETVGEVLEGLCGSIGFQNEGLFTNPAQSINYMECHDNYTVWDKLSFTNEKEEENVRRKMHQLGTALVLLAQGVPFLHAGQEFFRTKQGVENSYNSPDFINQLDWDRKEQFKKDVMYVKNLIALRKAHPAFRLKTKAEIKKHIQPLQAPDHVVAYHMNDLYEIDSWNNIVVIHNGSWSTVEISLPYPGQWHIVIDEETVSLIPLYIVEDEKIHVKPLTTMMMFQ